MNGQVRGLFEDKEFQKKIFYIQGYDICEAGKGKAASAKFRESVDLPVDWDLASSAIEQKGKVYYYRHKKEIKAVYIVRKTDSGFSCNDIYYASDLSDNLRDTMDKQVVFLIAERSNYLKEDKAFFKGQAIPKLIVKSKGFNWSMGACFALLYGVLFSNIFHNGSGWIIGAMFGLSTGLAMQEHIYSYEKAEGAETFDTDN